MYKKIKSTNKAVVICVAIAAALVVACSGVTTLQKQMPTISSAELNAAPQKHLSAIQQGRATVIFLAGDRVPAELTLELPFASLGKNSNTIVFSRDTYVLINSDGFLVSPDGIRYAAVDNPKALRKIYGATKGHMQVGYSAPPNEDPVLKIGVSLK